MRQFLLYLVNQVQDPHQFRAHYHGTRINFTSLSLPVSIHLFIHSTNICELQPLFIALKQKPLGSLLSRGHWCFSFPLAPLSNYSFFYIVKQIISLYPDTSTFIFPTLYVPLLDILSEKSWSPDEPLFLGPCSKMLCSSLWVASTSPSPLFLVYC